MAKGSTENVNTCGAKGRQSGKPCRRPAGWGTDHVGQGKCKLHGGATPIKHGRFSSIKRPRIQELIATLKDDPNPMDLLPEVLLLRALTIDLIERWESIFGVDGALLAWHQSYLNPEAQAAAKPREMPDYSSIGTIVDRIGKMVERIHKMQQTGTISLATLEKAMEQMGVQVVQALKAAKIDADKLNNILADIEKRWSTIHINN